MVSWADVGNTRVEFTTLIFYTKTLLTEVNIEGLSQ